MPRLAGKVAIVTGASKGIGAGTAIKLANEGASVLVNYAADKKGADSLVLQIRQAGAEAVAVSGDVSQEESAEARVQTISAPWSLRRHLQIAPFILQARLRSTP